MVNAPAVRVLLCSCENVNRPGVSLTLALIPSPDIMLPHEAIFKIYTMGVDVHSKT